MAAMPPSPPGSQPPQPPSTPSGPPQASTAQPYVGQMPPQPYPGQYAGQAPVVKVHHRTFFLTIAQLLIILLAIVRILIGLAAAGFGVLFLIGGRSRIESLPGYNQAFANATDTVFNALAAVLFIFAAYWLIAGIVDLVLGIIVGRPSNVARWFIIVLDVLSILYFLGLLSRNPGSFWTLLLLVVLAAKVIVFYALALDPATRRDFAGTSR